MKKNIHLLICCVVLLAFAGCKNPAEDINLVVNTATVFKSPVLVHFSNANIMSTTSPGDFKVTISGKDAALVQMGSGGTDFKALHGFLPLALKSSASPSGNSPVTFNISAEVPGFAPITKTILITADSTKVYEVPVIEYAKPVDGTLVLQSDVALNAGTTTAVVNLATTTNAALSEKASIVIPTGTQMLDANGTVINTSQVKASIVQYGSSNPAIAESFPGGLSPVTVFDNAGNPIVGGINFVTAGLLSINMTAGTSAVKKFSKPLEVSQELQTGLINYETGVATKVGDVIPLWSLNEATGEWKAEGNATVAAGTNGKLVAKYNITHLSGWNLDWGYTSTNSAPPLTINLLPSVTPWIGSSYEVQLQTSNGGYLAGLHYYVPQTDFFELGKLVNGYITKTIIPGKYGFTLPVVPKLTSVKVVVYNNSYVKIAESPLFNPNTTSTVNLNITAPSPPETINVIADFSGTCSAKKVVAPLNGYVYMYDYTDSRYTYFYLSGGKIYNASNNGATLATTTTSVGGSIKLTTGHTYNIQTYLDGSYYTSPQFVLTKSSFEIPIAAANLGAVTTYNATTNTLLIKGSYSINCK